MPELPEVETIVRTLAPRLEGRRIVTIRTQTKKPWAATVGRAAGQGIHAVRRYGKYILIELDRGFLAIHLGMTGRLSFGGEPGPHTRCELLLNAGRLRFDDARQFGSVRWIEQELSHLGPDALEVSAEEFITRLRRRKGRIKSLLLNQRFLRGIGNIYADEALFRARIHPLAEAPRLSRERALRLHGAIRRVLSEAVKAGGSSVSDYIDPEGRKGLFQFRHRVYRRTGEPCKVCGARIRRILAGQRSTHFCPRCQRR